MELAALVYRLTMDMPISEQFNLTHQLKKSSTSIPSNIAEGAGRNSNKEFIHFLSIANGSAFELQTQLLLTEKLELLKIEQTKPLIDMCIELQKMNYVLQKRL